MSRHRVRLEFDVELLDEDKANWAAAKVWRRSGQITAEDGKSAEDVALERARLYPNAVATTVAAEALLRGAGNLPWLRLSKVEFDTMEPK
jgi:hypothetical protein